jgi:hypothetical protein
MVYYFFLDRIEYNTSASLDVEVFWTGVAKALQIQHFP